MKRGLPCVDCWPSSTNSSLCENSRYLHSDPAAVTADSVASTPSSSHLDSYIATRANSDQDSDFGSIVSFLSQPKEVLKRIPGKSRISVARRLATLVEQVVARNDIPSWSALLPFPKKCLFTPPRGGKRWNLVPSSPGVPQHSNVGS